jgi:hypothetical protein
MVGKDEGGRMKDDASAAGMQAGHPSTFILHPLIEESRTLHE